MDQKNTWPLQLTEIWFLLVARSLLILDELVKNLSDNDFKYLILGELVKSLTDNDFKY